MMHQISKTSKRKAQVKVSKNKEKFIIKKKKISVDFSDPDVFQMHDDDQLISLLSDRSDDFKLEF